MNPLKWLIAVALVCGACLSASVARADVSFGPAEFLPGDVTIGSPVGIQVDADVAVGDGLQLVVWSDGRTSPDDAEPFATEGSGMDVYGAFLDEAGNVVGDAPLVIDAAFGDQKEPRVAWNGENWLVIWRQDQHALPTYEEILAVRIAPDGSVLDATPIVIHSDQSFDSDAVVEGGAGEWVVLFLENGTTNGVRAVRVHGDGTIASPGVVAIHNTNFLLSFDLAFAGDEYMIVWEGSFDAPRGRRYTTTLQPIGTSVLPYGQRVASDGDDFLVVRASGSPPGATVNAILVGHDGTVGTSRTLYTGANQEGTCCADVTWDGTHYWVGWGGPRLARVSATGQVLDPGGLLVTPPGGPSSMPRFVGAVGGGVQFVYHDGVNGAPYPKDVYAAVVSPSRQLGSEVLVSRGAPSQLEADFAAGDGLNAITFSSRTSDGGRVLVQRLDDLGQALDAEPIEVVAGPIPGIGTPTLGAPAIAWNGSSFLVTWSDGLEIFARRMLADGTFLDATPRTVMDGHSPDVDAVGDVFLVAGLDYLSGNPHWQATHTMRVDGTTGDNLDAEPNALGGFQIFARYPHVVSWGDRWFVVWQRNLSHDNPVAGTTVAFVDADGTTPGVINLPVGWRPDAAVGDGVALIAAVTNSVASATTDLSGVILASDGTFGNEFTISSAADKQLRPAVAWNGTEFVVAWEDKRGAEIYFDERTDVFGTRVAVDGTVLDPTGIAFATSTTPELQPALLSTGTATLLAVSTFRSESGIGAYRVGIHRSGGATGVLGDGATTVGVTWSAYPNPFRGSTTIRLASPESRTASVRVFDAGGRLLRTLANEQAVAAGAVMDASWDGRDDSGRRVGAGVYFYRVETESESVGGKIVRVR